MVVITFVVGEAFEFLGGLEIPIGGENYPPLTLAKFSELNKAQKLPSRQYFYF